MGRLFLDSLYSSLHGSSQYCPVKLKISVVNHYNSLNIPVDGYHDLTLTFPFKILLRLALKKDNVLS